MPGIHHLPLSRQPLAFFISALLAGQALAEVAGKVSFVSGQVNAIALDGGERLLTRGAVVNSGERLETGKGRLQIRFTDGSFLSLQPNTVFRLDNYRFERDKPEEGTLLFNFVQGGMRTITGAIGRVNRARYKVRTPVASLGIRGTGYASTFNQGVLTLSVDKGIVNVENEFGSSNVNAGQTFRVLPGEAPRQAPDGVSADARAQPPSDLYETLGNEPDTNVNPGAGDAVLAGENPDRGEVLLSHVLPDSVYPAGSGTPQPSYTLGSRFPQAGNSLLLGGLSAVFDRSDDESRRGGLTGLTESTATSLNSLFSVGTGGNALHFNGVTTVGSLSFGEWTQGTAALGNLDRSDQTIVLGEGEYEPYIIGISAPQSVLTDAAGHGTRLSYQLAGGTIATATSGEAGVLRTLALNVTLAPVSLVDVDFRLSMASTGDYTASARNLKINNFNRDTSSGFSLTGSGLKAQGQGCGSNGCSLRLEAFFAGTDPQMGAVYLMDRSNGQISGVAALGLTGKDTVSQLLADNTAGAYQAVFVKHGAVSPVSAISADFSDSGLWTRGEVSAGDVYGPDSTATPPAGSQGVVHADRSLSWGQWSNGAAHFGNGNTVDLNSQGIHYLVGSPTTSGNLPTTQLSYSLIGGTRPTLAAYDHSPVSSGLLTGGGIRLDFSQNTAAMDLNMTFADGADHALVAVSGANGQLNGSSIAFDSMDVTVSANGGPAVACTYCYGSAAGFVSGQLGDMVGMGFAVQNVDVLQTGSGSISGIATFGNPQP